MVKYQFSLTHYSIFQEVVAFQTVKENFVKKSKIKVKSRAGNVDTQIQCLSRTEPWSLSKKPSSVANSTTGMWRKKNNKFQFILGYMVSSTPA